MKGKVYALMNAQERHRACPDSFEFPRARLHWIKVGDLVKLIFLDSESSEIERMWVEVTKVTGASYSGILRNHPIALALEWGDTVEFSREHIAEIHVPEQFAPEIREKDGKYLH